MKPIDLNADLGESEEAAAGGGDAALMESLSSVNIACGGHAGDESTMEAAVRAALRLGVAIGAHPGYPDRERFGRVELALSPDGIAESVFVQIVALARVALRLGARLAHVKPHGALYHAAARGGAEAGAIARAVQRADPRLALVGFAGSPALELWRSLGLTAVAEGFADRRYERDGSLRSRAHDDALLLDPAEAAGQALRIARGEGALAHGGGVVPVRAESICIHGDTPGAPAIARAVRAALDADGFVVRALP